MKAQTINPNGSFKTYDTARRMIKSSGYKLYHNKLFLFNKIETTACKLKKISVLDTFNGKTIKEVVKVL